MTPCTVLFCPWQPPNGEALGESWPVAEDGVFSTVLTPPLGVEANAPLRLRIALVDPAGRVGAVGAPVDLA